MYGDEFLDENRKPIKNYDKTSIPASNMDRCNPLFRVHKSEWVSDKIEREYKKPEQPKTLIYKREEMIKIIQQLQVLNDIRKLRAITSENGE